MARVAGTVTRICLDCKKEKKETLFYVRKKNKEGKWNRASRCIPCQANYRRQYGIQHRERLLIAKRKDYRDNWHRYTTSVIKQKLRKFDLPEEDYKLLLSHGCSICKSPNSGIRGLHFDHNHDTGKFRGMLCGNCNTALGLMSDNTDRLKKAIQYLEENK